MDDVIIVGAGPAGAFAATILARAGARVRVFDRARFPRDKLCGDTLNPGALRVLAAHMSIAPILQRGVALDGMVLTGPGGVRVRGHYGAGLTGRAITRRELDVLLMDRALAAGASFETEALVSRPVTDTCGGHVTGVTVSAAGCAASVQRARLVIAADGRASRLARALSLSAHPSRPRRWAIGAYFEGVRDLTSAGEMHVRAGHYLGVAPVPGGLANACLVVPRLASHCEWTDPAAALIAAIRREPVLAPRFEAARMIGRPHVMGPMAVDATAAGVPGLLLAGDAAGFIDPMTGDGLRLALAGAALAADTALQVLAGALSADAAPARLAEARHAAFSAKWRFNRALRSLVASPVAVSASAIAARVLPSMFQAVINYAGDCGTPVTPSRLQPASQAPAEAGR